MQSKGTIIRKYNLCFLVFIYVSAGKAIRNESLLVKGNNLFVTTLRPQEDRTEYIRQIVLNEYIDKFIDGLKTNGKNLNSGLESWVLPLQNFQVAYTGCSIALSAGGLNFSSSVERNGNALLSYNSNSKEVVVTMGFMLKELKISYDYDATLMFIPITGNLHGVMRDTGIHFSGGFDFNRSVAFVNFIDFAYYGELKVWLTGQTFVDWLTNRVLSLMTEKLKYLISEKMDQTASESGRQLVQKINNFLK